MIILELTAERCARCQEPTNVLELRQGFCIWCFDNTPVCDCGRHVLPDELRCIEDKIVCKWCYEVETKRD